MKMGTSVPLQGLGALLQGRAPGIGTQYLGKTAEKKLFPASDVKEGTPRWQEGQWAGPEEEVHWEMEKARRL